jgi:hypothetical protein
MEGGDRIDYARAFQATLTSTLIVNPNRLETADGFNGALTGTLLSNGNVLLTAGNTAASGQNGCCDARAYIYDPTSSALTLIPPRATRAGGFQYNTLPSVLLADGRVLVIGKLLDGSGNFGPVRDAEVYTPGSYLNPAPILSSVTVAPPDSPGRPTRIMIAGSNFLPNSSVRLPDTKLVTIYMGSAKLLSFVPSSLAVDLNSLRATVTNPAPGGGVASSNSIGVFPEPVIIGISPTSGAQGTTVTASLTGNNLSGATSVTFDGTGVAVAIQAGGSVTQVPLLVMIAPSAPPGRRRVTVTTPGGTYTSGDLFDVVASPPAVVTTAPQPIPEVEQGTIRTGYVIVTPYAGSLAPTATVMFGMVRQGAVQSQAAILPTAMTTETSLAAEFIGSIGRSTGLALANPGNSLNSLSLTLLNESGTVVGAPVTLLLQPQQQLARFVGELFAPDVVGSAFRGSVHVQSGTAFSALGLRFSGGGFTTLPIPVTNATVGVPPRTLLATATADTPTPGTAGGNTSLIFPQFAMGGGWATQITLVNLNPSSISGRVDIFDSSGNPMNVPLNGATKSTFSFFILPNGTLTLAPRDTNGQSPM